MPFDGTFGDVAAILLIAAAIGALGLWLRQPLIVSFIAAGILAGPAGFGLVREHEEIELFASVGISVLLFVVGLKLDLQTIRTLGPVALATGVGQIVFTSVIGFALALALGMDPLTALYVSVALTFSSTIIIVKLLSDKREIDALHGRIAVGFLIVQDLAVILAMIGITALGAERAAGESPIWQVAGIAGRGVAFVGGVAALGAWVLPRFTRLLARSTELLVLAGVAWAVILAAAGESLGFSRELGAFLAGASLASTPYREAIGSRLVTLRDFLLLFFFVDLGARLDLSLLGTTLGAALLLSCFVLVGNPLIVMAIMGIMGYRKRTGFLAGLTVAQISEFSLILAALGLEFGHIDLEAMGLVTTVGLVTIGLSTYMILYSGPLYERIGPWLGVFERANPHREASGDTTARRAEADAVVFGLGRYGGGIVRHLRLRNRTVIGVDFDPEALEHWRSEGVAVHYGDATDPELFEHLPLDNASWVISTTPDAETNRVLLRHLQDRGYRGRVAVSCRTADEGDLLRLNGAHLLLRPYTDAAEQAADAITAAMDRLSTVAARAPGLREVRLAPGSIWAGRRIENVPLRDEFGVTVLAVSRAGRSFFNPGADFQLFPGDRVILSGAPEAMEHAVEYLGRVDYGTGTDEAFEIHELSARDAPVWQGRSLADLHLRKRFGVTVLAFIEGEGRMTPPDPNRLLADDDRLVLFGASAALADAVADAAGTRAAESREA